VSELEAVTKLEQALILQIGKLEDERETLAEKFAGQLGMDASEITVTNLSKRLGGEDAERLKTCCSKFESRIKALKSTNELNTRLIKNSLDYIDFSMNIFANTSSANNLYGNSGQANDSKKRNFFDMRL
jgi:flagellar biosynthesis/type III secretory pathway chaperone